MTKLSEDILHRDINGVQICMGDVVMFAFNKGSRGSNCKMVKTIVVGESLRTVTTNAGKTMSPEDRIMILDGEFVGYTKTKDYGKG